MNVFNGSNVAHVAIGDNLATLRTYPDKSIHACITSPPYYGLRDYGHDGQIGLEDTPDAFIARLVGVFREVRRVLRDDGVLWLNMGDSYSNAGTRQGDRDGNATAATNEHRKVGNGYRARIEGLKNKDLIGIPWMLAFALRADGWFLRQDIIWHKPNPMPESVTDRCTKAHEYLFILTKSERYYFDHEAIKEPALSAGRVPGGNKKVDASRNDAARDMSVPVENARNRRSVWTVTTKPYKGAHFATFPPDLIEPCVLASTSEHGHCPTCGTGWVRVVDRATSFEGGSGRAGRTAEDANAHGKHIRGDGDGNKNLKLGPVVTSNTVGWRPGCDCDTASPVVPGLILDPFGGSGTTAGVALANGRNAILCELNPTYAELVTDRIKSILTKASAGR